MADLTLSSSRAFLKDHVRRRVDFRRTDQSMGVPPPPIEKPFNQAATLVPLRRIEDWPDAPVADLTRAIRDRRSRRRYLDRPLSLDEVAYLVWACAGVGRRLNAASALRTVPSAGCRHALELYVCSLNVEGLERGVYRYLPLEHALLPEYADDNLGDRLGVATLGQSFVGSAAVTLVWTAVPYRMEWRYGLASHKVIALDAGHACQNVYLACAAIGAGACAVAAYDQDLMDGLMGVDGEEEFTVYLCPVGKYGATTG